MGPTWYLGTMGFSYEDWRGAFYPDPMPSRNFLAHYSKMFNAVEIDSTFYGTPRASTILRWKRTVAPEFRFCLKVPREITHELSLQIPHAADALTRFYDVAGKLGDRLGVILFQFPPSFDGTNRARLERFLGYLDRRFRHAVEFRHPSWFRPETYRILTGAGVSLASTEYPGVPGHSHWTADHVYLRWIGHHGRFPRHDREQADPTANLNRWYERLMGSLESTQTVFGFFNNDYAGFAPASCQRFQTLLDLPKASFEPPRQGRLFR